MLDSIDNFRLSLLSPLGRAALPDGYWRNPDRSRQAAINLTFDDGPHPETTPELLDILDEHDVKATFFFTGRNVKRHPRIVRDVAERGHQIGNHSYSHHLSVFLTEKTFAADLDRTSRLIEEACHSTPSLYRPPFGIIDHGKARLVGHRQMQVVYWQAMAEDWNKIGADMVVRRIAAQMEPGSLVVLHETSLFPDQIIESTGRIIALAKERELRFDTIKNDMIN